MFVRILLSFPPPLLQKERRRTEGEERCSEKANDMNDDDDAFISSFHIIVVSAEGGFPRPRFRKKKTTRDAQREARSLSRPLSSEEDFCVCKNFASI